MSSTLKVAVVGAGSLGKEHARIYAELARAGLVQFVGVHDAAVETAQKIAAKYSTRAFASLKEAAGATRVSHWGGHRFPGKVRPTTPEARRPVPGQPIQPSRKGWLKCQDLLRSG